MKKIPAIFLCMLLCLSCKQAKKEAATVEPQKENWIQLFNGENLDGWTVKITGYPVGENFGNTFRVENGLLRTSYEAYDDSFNSRFGHLYTNKEYSHYKLRVEYRFTDKHINNAPGWTYLNGGAMLHAQAPESMHIDQDFPVSVEAQMLGSDEKVSRSTGNVCSPGTDIFIDSTMYPDHCASSTSPAYDSKEWISMEMVVLGDSIVHHIVEGDTVITYTHLTADGKGINPETSIVPGALKSGRIALQSEGHPMEFRKVELLDLSQKK